MSLTREQLLLTPTLEECQAEVDAFLADQLKLPVLSWQPGGVLRTFRELMMQLTYQGYQRTASFVRKVDMLSCDTSDPNDDATIDLHASSSYRERRIPGVSSQYVITVEDPAGPRTVPAYELQVGLTDDASLIWRNPVAFSTAVSGTVTATVVCDSVGTATNVPTGTITKQLAGPAGLVVNNPTAPTVLGADRETSAALVARCVAKWSLLSPIEAVADRYTYVAATALANCRTAVVTNAFGAGTVGVYLATATGTATAPQVAAVQAAIDAECFGGAVTCTVVAATAVPVAYTASIKLNTGSWATTSDKQAAVLSVITSAINAHPVGGEAVDGTHLHHLSPETLRSAVYECRIAGNQVVRWCDQSAPGAIVDLGATGVATLGTTSITWS